MAKAKLFYFMLLEDWRHHTRLFGSLRFALFPIQLTLLVAATAWALTLTDIGGERIILGVHVLVLIFGLHTGSAAFEGTDTLNNVMGDVTYLLFSARTLPISQRELFTIFIAKDIVYYTALFVLPVTVGLLPVLALTSVSLSVSGVAVLLTSFVLVFLFGLGASVLGVTLFTGSLWRRAIAFTGLTGALLWVLQSGVSVASLTPYGLHTATTASDMAIATIPTAAVLVSSIALYNPTPRTRTRTSKIPYAKLRDTIPSHIGLLAVKTLLDVRRGSGGFLKVGFTAAIYAGAIAFLMWAVEQPFGIELNPGIAFGVLFSLTAYTTHTWITQIDSVDEYLFQPLAVTDIFRAKYLAFTALTVPTATIFYAVAMVYWQPTLIDALLGGVLFVALSTYVFGLTVYMTGLDPDDFMFDTIAYTIFSLAVMTAVFPPLLISFITPLPTSFAAGLIVWATVLVTTGIYLARTTPLRWHGRYH